MALPCDNAAAHDDVGQFQAASCGGEALQHLKHCDPHCEAAFPSIRSLSSADEESDFPEDGGNSFPAPDGSIQALRKTPHSSFIHRDEHATPEGGGGSWWFDVSKVMRAPFSRREAQRRGAASRCLSFSG